MPCKFTVSFHHVLKQIFNFNVILSFSPWLTSRDQILSDLISMGRGMLGRYKRYPLCALTSLPSSPSIIGLTLVYLCQTPSKVGVNQPTGQMPKLSCFPHNNICIQYVKQPSLSRTVIFISLKWSTLQFPETSSHLLKLMCHVLQPFYLSLCYYFDWIK